MLTRYRPKVVKGEVDSVRSVWLEFDERPTLARPKERARGLDTVELDRESIA